MRKSTICQSRNRGVILVELLVTAAIALLIGVGLLDLMQATYIESDVNQGQSTADAGARTVMDALADNLRNAQVYKVQTNPDAYAVLSAASESSITCYVDSAGSNARYWLDTSSSPYKLMKEQTVNGVATTLTLLSNVQSISLTYYKASSNAYNLAQSGWVTTNNLHAPTSSEMPLVGAVKIFVQVTINGYTRQSTSFVRLRNSPYKSSV